MECFRKNISDGARALSSLRTASKTAQPYQSSLRTGVITKQSTFQRTASVPLKLCGSILAFGSQPQLDHFGPIKYICLQRGCLETVQMVHIVVLWILSNAL